MHLPSIDMRSDIIPFLKKQHTIKEIDGLVRDLYSQRGDLDILAYTELCHDLLSERREFERRASLLRGLEPALGGDASYAAASFGPLAEEYLALRWDLLLTWQPVTIALVESVITLARLMFRRCLVRRESGLFYGDPLKRKTEMQETKGLNIEIDRFTESMDKQFSRKVGVRHA